MGEELGFLLPSVVFKESGVSDGIDTDVSRGLNSGLLVEGVVAGDIGDMAEVKVDRQGFLGPVDGGVDFFKPGKSKDNIFISKRDNVKGYFLCNSFNAEEEDGGEANKSFTVNGVVGVSGLDWFF